MAGQLGRLGALLGRAGHGRQAAALRGTARKDLHKEQAMQREQSACRVRVHAAWQLDIVLHRHLSEQKLRINTPWAEHGMMSGLVGAMGRLLLSEAAMQCKERACRVVVH